MPETLNDVLTSDLLDSGLFDRHIVWVKPAEDGKFHRQSYALASATKPSDPEFKEMGEVEWLSSLMESFDGNVDDLVDYINHLDD